MQKAKKPIPYRERRGRIPGSDLRRNGTRGFIQTLSVTRAPGEVKSLAYTAEHIRGKLKASEFSAVTDAHLIAENERHRFVQETLREAAIELVPLEGFAVWVAKMKPVIQ